MARCSRPRRVEIEDARDIRRCGKKIAQQSKTPWRSCAHFFFDAVNMNEWISPVDWVSICPSAHWYQWRYLYVHLIQTHHLQARNRPGSGLFFFSSTRVPGRRCFQVKCDSSVAWTGLEWQHPKVVSHVLLSRHELICWLLLFSRPFDTSLVWQTLLLYFLCTFLTRTTHSNLSFNIIHSSFLYTSQTMRAQNEHLLRSWSLLVLLNVRLTDDLAILSSNQNKTLFRILLIQITRKLKTWIEQYQKV